MIKREEDVAHRFSSNGKKGEFLHGTEGREGEWEGEGRSGKRNEKRGGTRCTMRRSFVRGFCSRNPRWKLTLRMPRTALGFQEGRARVVATPHREVLQTMSRQTWLTLRSVYYRDNPAPATYRVASNRENLLQPSPDQRGKKKKREEICTEIIDRKRRVCVYISYGIKLRRENKRQIDLSRYDRYSELYKVERMKSSKGADEPSNTRIACIRPIPSSPPRRSFLPSSPINTRANF